MPELFIEQPGKMARAEIAYLFSDLLDLDIGIGEQLFGLMQAHVF